MYWRNNLNGVLNFLINYVNIFSKKATNDILGFPNIASHAFFDNIIAL